jgi:phage-related protein
LFPKKETINFEIKKPMNAKFKVVFTEEAAGFLDSLSDKARNKVYFNIDKATFINDPEVFKKLEDDIWEFRTLYQQQAIRLFAFWDKDDKTNTLVISTHGLIKKTQKTPKKEIDKAKQQRVDYFNQKQTKK